MYLSLFFYRAYKHETVSQLFLTYGFENKLACFSPSHSYLQGFSCVVSQNGAKIDFLLWKIILVHFTCIPSFSDICVCCVLSRFSCVWLCVTLWTTDCQAPLDYSEWNIRKEKHFSSYAVTQKSLTSLKPRIIFSINRTTGFLGLKYIYIFSKRVANPQHLWNKISLIMHFYPKLHANFFLYKLHIGISWLNILYNK